MTKNINIGKEIHRNSYVGLAPNKLSSDTTNTVIKIPFLVVYRQRSCTCIIKFLPTLLESLHLISSRETKFDQKHHEANVQYMSGHSTRVTIKINTFWVKTACVPQIHAYSRKRCCHGNHVFTVIFIKKFFTFVITNRYIGIVHSHQILSEKTLLSAMNRQS